MVIDFIGSALSRLGRKVVANLRLVRSVLADKLYFHRGNFRPRGRFRFPKYLSPYGEVAPLFSREIVLERLALRAPVIVDAVGAVLSDVNLAVRVCDLVNDVHALQIGYFA